MTGMRAVVAALAIVGGSWSLSDGQAPRSREWRTMVIAGFPASDSKHASSDGPRRANDIIRVAALMRDGTVELRKVSFPDDGVERVVASGLAHRKPIRDQCFVEECRLLLTTSDDSVKLWDGVTGEFRKELAGQVARPANQCAEGRVGWFLTVDSEGRVVTTWDGETLEPRSSFRVEGPKLIGAGHSPDGRALVTIGEDRSITLRRPDGRPIASKPPGSELSRLVFKARSDGTGWEPLGIGEVFWIAARHLLPKDGAAGGK